MPHVDALGEVLSMFNMFYRIGHNIKLRGIYLVSKDDTKLLEKYHNFLYCITPLKKFSISSPLMGCILID